MCSASLALVLALYPHPTVRVFHPDGRVRPPSQPGGCGLTTLSEPMQPALREGQLVRRSGTVVDVNATSFSVRFKDGNDVRVLYPTPAVLGTGRPMTPDETTTYELPDVRVGDVVDVVFVPRDGRNVCHQIVIYRRPGGKIPPYKSDLPRGNLPGNINPWHARMQAYQDWEEKGIPIPDKHLPVHPAELSHPLPPVAPKPRVAGPKP